MPAYTLLIVGAVAAFTLYKSFFAGDQDPPPPSHQPSQPPPPVRRHDERQHRVNIDSFESQRDYLPVETYASLRAEAKKEGELRTKYLRQSQEAYQRRDHARAKSLSDKGNRHALKMDKLNAKASAIIFKENNRDRDACNVDLHGLYVKEAIAYSENALAIARQRGDSKIRLIVGQGNHSDGGVSRLKPAIQKAMRKRRLLVQVEPRNPGVLLVSGW